MRYFFYLLGAEESVDLIGAVFENDAAVRQEAALRSLAGEGFRLQKYVGYHSIEVRDETARVVCRVPIQH